MVFIFKGFEVPHNQGFKISRFQGLEFFQELRFQGFKVHGFEVSGLRGFQKLRFQGKYLFFNVSESQVFKDSGFRGVKVF
jgi:hypothetical protein